MNSGHGPKRSAHVTSTKPKAEETAKTLQLRTAATPKHGKQALHATALVSGVEPSYEELLHFFDDSADLLCIAGFDGKFKRLNPTWVSLLGWTMEELKAAPFLDFVHPDDRPSTLAEMNKLDSGVATIEFRNRYRRKDGSWRWLQWTATPQQDRREIYAVARDVTEQKRLEVEILATLDCERERMGRELHDGLCQNLAGIAALSATLARKLGPATAPMSAAALELGRLLGDCIKEARDLARGLNPLHLNTLGLRDALADFCVNTGNLFGIACGFQCDQRNLKLEANCEIQLYRIGQEAVNNAIAHGRAKWVEISLAFENGRLTLAIEDDGIGMAAPLAGHRGIGLQSMAYRARSMGALFEVKRRTPRGTVVSCMFPAQLAQLES
jgi:PAS domain S-box-containing protein